MTVEERDQVDSVENSDIEFDDWNEVLDQQIICPFTERTFDCYDDFLANCRGELGMDFEERIAKLDFYSRIGFVNWARIHKRVPDNDEFLQEAYLKPVLENDCLLQMLDCDQAEPDAYEKLQQEFKEYKNMVENTFMSSAVKQQLSAIRTETPTITDEPAKPLDYYFGSYCETAIHQTMLKDEIRTLAYRDFCYDNKDFLNGKVVLDVGCGTGILSMFCAKMGAKVYAVDNSTVIQKARQIAAENNLADRITFIQGQIEDIEIGEQVDIIISEWMGYFLLFEGMLDSVLYARDKWLKPGGMMAPNKAKMLLACMTDEEWYNDNYHYWNDVYGFKMTSMKSQFITDATVEYCNSDCLVSTSSIFAVLLF